MSRPDQTPRPALRRVLWFVALWCAGVGLLSLVALAIRAAIGA